METKDLIPTKVLEEIFGHDEDAQRAFISALAVLDLSKASQENRLPAGLIKKEGKGTFSLFPSGRKSNKRIVVTLDPNNPDKLIFFKYCPQHDQVYEKALQEAPKKYEKDVLNARVLKKAQEKLKKRKGRKGLIGLLTALTLATSALCTSGQDWRELPSGVRHTRLAQRSGRRDMPGLLNLADIMEASR